MNKDALLATIIGFVVGLFITGLLLVGPKLISLLPSISWPSFSFGQTNPAVTPTPDTTNDKTLRVDSPLPDSIESSEELLVSGATEPNAVVVLQTDSDDQVVLTKEDGKFAAKLSLIEGKNDLTVISYGKTKQETKTIIVFYTPEEF